MKRSDYIAALFGALLFLALLPLSADRQIVINVPGPVALYIGVAVLYVLSIYLRGESAAWLAAIERWLDHLRD
jgi:hypothetical protein